MVVVTGCFTRESFLPSCQNGGAHAIWYAIGGSPAGKKMGEKKQHCNLSGACHQSLGKCHKVVLFSSCTNCQHMPALKVDSTH